MKRTFALNCEILYIKQEMMCIKSSDVVYSTKDVVFEKTRCCVLIYEILRFRKGMLCINKDVVYPIKRCRAVQQRCCEFD